MRKNSIRALALGLATTFAGGAGYAQNDTPLDEPSTQSILHAQDMKDLKQIRATKLLGTSVTSKDGDNLGQVKDLVFDPATGRIKFALVSQGFMAGLGEKLIPVPWKAISVHSEREFALNVDKDKLRTAPNWNQSEMEQPDYIIRIYRFYELEPQSDIGGPGESSTELGRGSGASSDTPASSDQFKDQDLNKDLNQSRPDDPSPESSKPQGLKD